MISLVLSIALGVFLAVGLFVFKKQQYEELRQNARYASEKIEVARFVPPVKEMIGAFAAPVVLVLFISCITIISAGHIGVQVTLGEVNQQTLSEGLHLVNPISSVKDVDVRVIKADLKNSNAGTKDLQVVHTDIVVNYRIDGTKAAHMYKEFGLDLEDKILLPAINESFKATTAHYDSEELVTKRDEVSNKIKEELQNKVAKYGLSVSEISLVNFGFSAEYQNAIEQKVIATQSKLKAEQDLQRIKVEADQAIAKAKGEAEAIKIQSQAISQGGGKDYVNLKAIEKWDGKLPNVNGGAMPFLNVGK
jgi:regulator of protease activity HflC (stomatin/prohibitin superfamily)